MNDDEGWDGDVERVKEGKVVRSGNGGRDEGTQDHNQLAVWIIGKLFAGVNGIYGKSCTSRVGMIYDGNLSSSRLALLGPFWKHVSFQCKVDVMYPPR